MLSYADRPVARAIRSADPTQRLHGVDVDVSLLDIFGDLVRLRRGQFAAADLLPKNVADLCQKQLGGIPFEVRIEVAQGVIGMHLRHEPLDHDAGINNEAAHRSRSSATKRALSLCGRPSRVRRMASARSRVAIARARVVSSRVAGAATHSRFVSWQFKRLPSLKRATWPEGRGPTNASRMIQQGASLWSSSFVMERNDLVAIDVDNSRHSHPFFISSGFTCRWIGPVLSLGGHASELRTAL